jgi:hypothetical protein
MKEPSPHVIEFDKKKIDEQIASYGDYYSQGVKVKKWNLSNEESLGNSSKSTEKYVAYFEKDYLRFSGIINNKYKRDGYGLEMFSNGDKYIGQFNSDLREGNGIYFFAPTNNNMISYHLQVECYLGKWKNNVIDKNGIYIWMDEPVNSYEYDDANFDAYIGEFEEGKYKRGTYITKSNNDYTLYHGNFDKEGEKNDNDAYYYISKNHQIFHGKIKKDVLISGFLCTLDEEGDKVIDLIYCKFNEDGSINDVFEERQLNKYDVVDEKKKLVDFRNIILDGDHFGRIYKKYSRIKFKIDKLVDISGILEREENIREIDKILNKYAKKNIYNSIEEIMYGREI